MADFVDLLFCICKKAMQLERPLYKGGFFTRIDGLQDAQEKVKMVVDYKDQAIGRQTTPTIRIEGR